MNWLSLADDAKKESSWSEAIRQGDFAKIADWFTARFFVVGMTGVVAAGIAAYLDHGWPFAARLFALALLMAGACTISGWLLGLLFGIPRSLARPGTVAPPAGNDAQSAAAAPGPSSTSRANTNLEDISDWLTKTIVGVGLTQIYAVPGFLGNLARDINQYGFGWQSGGQLLALALIFYFVPGGFWLGYVGTRTILTRLFDETDKSLNAAQVAKAAAPSNLQASDKGVKPADPSLALIDQELLRKPLESLGSLSELVGWAAAKARSGDLGTAKVVLENALRSNPDDSAIKQQLATVYTALGNHSDAAKLLVNAPDTPTAVLNALYEDPPGGFQKAIQIGQKLAATPAYRDNPNLHVWLACAYAQQYGYAVTQQSPQSEHDTAKQNMLREARTAIQLLPAAKDWLHAYWKPAVGAIDNDLAVFAPDDPDLTSLLEK